MTGNSKHTTIEMSEIESDNLDKVFGGNSEYERPENYAEIQDTDRTIPSDPSRRKKKRLNVNEE